MSEAFPAAADDALWRRAVDRVLKGADFERALVSRSHDGIALRPLYAKADGALPARGGDGRRFRIVQRVDHPVAAEANVLALADLEGGAEGLVLSLRGAASARGFGLDVADLDLVLDSVRLDLIDLRVECPPFAGRVAAAALTDLVARRGLDPARLALDYGLDPIGDMARCGAPPRLWSDLADETGQQAASLRTTGFTGPLLRADGRLHHEAGASEAQELAALLSTAVTYLRVLETAGFELEAGRAAISFLLAADTDFTLSLCKFRALRHLWAHVEASCGLPPAPMRLDAETSWRTMTRRDPHGNLLRATLAGTAAILGGADSLIVLPFTSALGLPDAAARRLARNTALILREEAHLAKVIDPAAGAGAFETLTLRLCEEAWALFQDLERSGGIVSALKAGTWQARLAATRAKRREDIAQGRPAIVGTTLFPATTEATPAVLMRPGATTAPAGATIGIEPLPSIRDAEPFEIAEPAEIRS